MKCLSDNPERLRAAVERAGGNLTRAARRLGASVTWTKVLVRRHALSAWARGLRLEQGQPATGHPRRKKKTR